MTGFPRPNRSFYLDDMAIEQGAVVRCKCAMGQPQFTAGMLYRVQPDGTLIDDTGRRAIPSARFTYIEQEQDNA